MSRCINVEVSELDWLAYLCFKVNWWNLNFVEEVSKRFLNTWFGTSQNSSFQFQIVETCILEVSSLSTPLSRRNLLIPEINLWENQ